LGLTTAADECSKPSLWLFLPLPYEEETSQRERTDQPTRESRKATQRAPSFSGTVTYSFLDKGGKLIRARRKKKQNNNVGGERYLPLHRPPPIHRWSFKHRTRARGETGESGYLAVKDAGVKTALSGSIFLKAGGYGGKKDPPLEKSLRD